MYPVMINDSDASDELICGDDSSAFSPANTVYPLTFV